jgi:hypothetical protein
VQANAVGNRGGASPTLTLTIDRTANKLATPVLDGASDSGTVGDWITAVTTPKLVGTGAEAGAKVEVREGTTVLGSATADSDGSWSFNLSTLGTGKHSLSLRQIDVADNISADATFDLTIDPSAVTAVAPPAKLAAPVLSSADTGHLSFDGITKEGTLAFSGTGAVANATIDLLQDGAVVKSVTAGSNGAWSVALSTALVDGSYAFAVRQTDSGHHQSESSESLHITVDTTAPGQPGISQSTVSDTGASHSDGITSYDSPIFSGTGADANATIDLYAGTTLVATGYADASGNWSVQPPAAIVDGTYSFTVRQSDLAGNISVSSTGVSVTIDTHVVAPSAPALADASDTGAKGDLLTADNTPSLSGGGCEANADVEIFDGTTLLKKVSADADGKWTYTLGTLLDGVHQLSVRQTDLAGNVSASSTSISLKVDTAAPAALLAPALSSLSDSGVSDHDGITKITTPTFTGSGADANTRIELYDGATLVGFTNSDASGNYSVTVSSLTALSDGAHGLSVRQVDGAGNASANSSTVSVTIDTAAPQLGTPSSPLFGTLNIPFNELVSHSAFGTVEIYASSNILQNSYTGSATNAWTDVTSGSNPYSVLHLNISQGSGSVTVSGTVQDLAGNVTVIGATSFPFAAPTSFFQPLPLY